MRFTGKTAVITGGGRGIGRAIAEKLSREGANVVINDIVLTDELKEFVAQIGEGRAVAVAGNVAKFEDMKALVEKAVEVFGGIDIIVNNAGITRDALILRMDEEAWDSVLAVNLKGAFNLIKAASRQLTKQRSGVIVNIASVVGIIGNAGQANYSASKAGLIALTKTVAKEFASRNIRCNAVAPGFIQSDMTDKLPDGVKEQYLRSIPVGRFGTPDDVADAVCFLASDEAKYITGQVLHIDGGLVM